MTIKVPNEEVLRAGVAHAEAHLEHWNQATWVSSLSGLSEAGEPACGTTACLAGHILLSQGMTWPQILAMQEADENGDWEDDDFVDLSELALTFLGFSPPTQGELDLGELFEHRVFQYVAEYVGNHSRIPLMRTQEALDLLKKRITSVTGIEF